MAVLSVSDREGNLEEQENERELLLSMFDQSAVTVEGEIMTITIKSKYFILILRCLYHDHYPSHEPPIFTIINMTNSPQCSLDISRLEEGCGQSFNPGECVVYKWVVYLDEYLETLDRFIIENTPNEPDAQEEEEDEEGEKEDDDGEIVTDMESLAITENFTLDELQSNVEFQYNILLSESEFEKSTSKLKIHTGHILTERKSHFQAHVCRVTCKNDIDDALATLLQNSKIAAATHNIMAYRYTTESGTIQQDYDDDGEAKAGGRLLELIDLMKVENLLVVVSRWYGGVHLGPARFKCINNIARETILESGLYDAEQGKKRKKKK